MRNKRKIPVEQLKSLYESEHLSTLKIGMILGCSRQTITNNLIRYNIPRRTSSQARVKYYLRNDFDGTEEEKAYMIGFRLGDLHVYKTSESSETIVVRCHSTSVAQVKLMECIFSKYGKVTVSFGIHGYTINCFLNISFNFLLQKQDNVEDWVTHFDSTFLAFIGGYIDAEGCFQINQNRGRFALASCDKNILISINDFLRRLDINCIVTKISARGTKSIGKYCFNNDVWRININDRRSLSIFILLIKPYIKHQKRITDMQRVYENLELRSNKLTI